MLRRVEIRTGTAMVNLDASLYWKCFSCITIVHFSIIATYTVFNVETYQVKNVGIGKK